MSLEDSFCFCKPGIFSWVFAVKISLQSSHCVISLRWSNRHIPYIYHKNQLNIGKSTIPMDPSWVCSTWSSCRYFSPKTHGSVANLHEVVGVHDLNNPTNYQNVPALGGNGVDAWRIFPVDVRGQDHPHVFLWCLMETCSKSWYAWRIPGRM